MARKKRNRKEEDKPKTYLIKMPVYTTSIIEEDIGFFGAMNYAELVEMLKNRITTFKFPIEYRNNYKTMVVVIDGITPIEAKVGDVPALLLKISSYKTNLIDGYFESSEKIHFQKTIKLVVMRIMSFFIL